MFGHVNKLTYFTYLLSHLERKRAVYIAVWPSREKGQTRPCLVPLSFRLNSLSRWILEILDCQQSRSAEIGEILASEMLLYSVVLMIVRCSLCI